MQIQSIAQATGGVAVTSAKYAFTDEHRKLLTSFGFRTLAPDDALLIIGNTQLSVILNENQTEFYISLWFRNRSDKALNLGNRPLTALTEKLLTSIVKYGKAVDAGIAALDGKHN